MEQIEQQIGFSAPADTSDNFNQPVPFLADQLVQIAITVYYYDIAPPSITAFGDLSPYSVIDYIPDPL